MKEFSIFLFASIVSCQVLAQQLNYDWHFTAGGVGLDQVLGSTIDQNGNSILVGNFEDSLVVSGVTYRANEFATDGFVIKLDQEGQLMWMKELNVGTFDDVFLFDVTTDLGNNIFITGSFRGTVDADPSDEEFLLISDLDDIYLSKLSSDGDLVWAKNIRANNSEERILDIQMSEDGMLYLGGYIDVTPDHNNDVPFLVKFNPSDTSIVWNYAAATKGRVDGISELVVDGDVIYMVGAFEGESIFGTDPTNEMKLDAGNGKDMFVVKMTTDREIMWAINIGADLENDDVQGRSVAVDGMGGIYIAGDYDGLIDFDPGTGVAELDGFIKSFLLKLAPDGTFQWVFDHQGLRGKKVLLNDSGHPFALFESRGSNSEGRIDIGKFSSVGDSLWANSLSTESTFDVSVREMSFDLDESIYITANYSGEFKYDPNTEDAVVPVDDDNDFIYIKLNQDATSPSNSQQFQDPVKVFPNPVLNQLRIGFDQVYSEIDLQVLDGLGRKIYHRKFLNATTLSIPFNYPTGQYYIKYTVQGQVGIQKVQRS